MYLEFTFKSSELKRNTQVNVIIPTAALSSDEPCRVLWLFHGLSDNQSGWMRYTSIERYAKKYKIAVVMPNVDRSWYTDTAYDANYFSYVSKELPELCFKTFKQFSQKREDNIVAGLSMGGYGALKVALSNPQKYGTCISLSGSLDITRKGRPYNINEWRSIFGFDLQTPLELEGSKHDLFALATQNKEEGLPFPRLFLWCGTEDELIKANNLFDQHLTDLGVTHEFRTSEGNHSWKWWDLHIHNALKWAFDQ